MTGKVLWFDLQKSYGFIAIEDGVDVFVHSNDLSSKIEKDDVVEFDVFRWKGRHSARDVKVVTNSG